MGTVAARARTPTPGTITPSAAVVASGIMAGPHRRRITHRPTAASPTTPIAPDHPATRTYRLPPGRPYPLQSRARPWRRSEEHTCELQSLMRIPYAGFCSKKKHAIVRDNVKNTVTNMPLVYRLTNEKVH